MTVHPSNFPMPSQEPLDSFRFCRDEETAGTRNTQAIQNMVDTIETLQRQYPDDIRIVTDSLPPPYAATLRRINSIVLDVHQESVADAPTAFVLAIVDSKDRVNISKLEQVIVDVTSQVDGDERRSLLSLTPNDRLPERCGFASGTVPPFGLLPRPLLTVIDASLINDSTMNEIVLGGGGQLGQSIVTSINAIMNSSSSVHVASFRKALTINKISSADESIHGENAPRYPRSILDGHQKERYNKPFFSVAPPDTELAIKMIQETLPEEPALQPEWVSVIGYVSGVRQMARRLVFCDLAPPLIHPTLAATSSSDLLDVHPWRNPSNTTEDMAVQLIFGKTICQRWGVDDAEAAIRRLKVGHLVMIQGKTNVGNKNSLKNWISKRSLDIVVFDVVWLHTESETSVWTRPMNLKGMDGHPIISNKETQAQPAEVTTVLQTLPILKLQDMYPKFQRLDDNVRLVEDLSGITSFRKDLQMWLENNPDEVGLVGMDCEWKPTHLLQEQESQPVLLLQICLHDLQQIYLFDLQTLLRPLLNQTFTMNEPEQALAEAVSLLYKTERLVKVGFQLHNDLQRLAASYPHMDAFSQSIHSVLEVSKLGMKVAQLTRESTKDRFVTSSLLHMTERFVQRTLDKQEQTSDWSCRPLRSEQLEYASLDAVVTPYMTDLLLTKVGARFMTTPRVSLGRRENDGAFQGSLNSWRFILLDSAERLPILLWNAKRVVGETYLVSQSWTTGTPEPKLPSIPINDENAPYVDLTGVRRIPSHTVEMSVERMMSTIGSWTFKSKDRCALDLIEVDDDRSEYHFDVNDCNGSDRLDFNARSGFVEMSNAILLFVTLPIHNGRRQSRSYPNEWLEDGAILTWFVKQNDWKDGTTRLARKMLDSQDKATKDGESPPILLYVRRGKGTFYQCGRCRVVSVDNPNIAGDKSRESDQWNILKFYLLLQDFGHLQASEDFRELVNPSRARRVVFDENDS